MFLKGKNYLFIPGENNYSCRIWNGLGMCSRHIGKVAQLSFRAHICQRLRSPGIDSEESNLPAYVAWWDGTTNRVVVPTPQAGNRFLGSLKGLQHKGSEYNCLKFALTDGCYAPELEGWFFGCKGTFSAYTTSLRIRVQGLYSNRKYGPWNGTFSSEKPAFKL